MEREEEGGGPKAGQSARDNPNQDLVFHYSRERRLARASPAVRSLYEGEPRSRSLLRAIRANPSGLWVFFSILIVAAFMFVYASGNRRSGAPDLEGNALSLRALHFPGATHVLLGKKAAGEGGYTGPVDLALSAPRSENTPPIETRRVYFTGEAEEEFRFSLPFETTELLVVIRAGDTVRSFRVKAE
jgi:hypothetical protein